MAIQSPTSLDSTLFNGDASNQCIRDTIVDSTFVNPPIAILCISFSKLNVGHSDTREIFTLFQVGRFCNCSALMGYGAHFEIF